MIKFCAKWALLAFGILLFSLGCKKSNNTPFVTPPKKKIEPLNSGATPSHAYPDANSSDVSISSENGQHAQQSGTISESASTQPSSSIEALEAAEPDLRESQETSNIAGSEKVSTNTSIHGIPSLRMQSGALLAPENKRCERLQIYIPGHAQEFGLKGKVSSRATQDKWIDYLVGGENYNLGHKIKENGCPILILNDSSTYPSTSDLKEAMSNAGATELEIISHSGGYVGLESMMKNWEQSDIEKISSLKMLDNFYSTDTASALSKRIGKEKLREICKGFATSWRAVRVASVCPKVQVDKDVSFESGSPAKSMVIDRDFDHKTSVAWFL